MGVRVCIERKSQIISHNYQGTMEETACDPNEGRGAICFIKLCSLIAGRNVNLIRWIKGRPPGHYGLSFSRDEKKKMNAFSDDLE